MTSLPDDEFLEAFKAAFQADENDEAVYGWMVEESEAGLGEQGSRPCLTDR